MCVYPYIVCSKLSKKPSWGQPCLPMYSDRAGLRLHRRCATSNTRIREHYIICQCDCYMITCLTGQPTYGCRFKCGDDSGGLDLLKSCFLQDINMLLLTLGMVWPMRCRPLWLALRSGLVLYRPGSICSKTMLWMSLFLAGAMPGAGLLWCAVKYGQYYAD